MAVPPKTPDAVVDAIAKKYTKVNKDAAMQRKMKKLGFLREDMGPAEAKKFTAQRKVKERALLKEYGLLKNG